MTLSISTALMRCSDLTRDHADIRSKRIGVEVSPQGGLRVAATDGHVVALYKLPHDDCAVFGSFSAAGSDFPKWGASPWKVSLYKVTVPSGPNEASAHCVAHTSAGNTTARTAKKDRRVELSDEPAVVWTALNTFDRSHASGCVSVLEIGEIRDALELLHENVEIRLVLGDGDRLCLVAGTWVCETRLDVPGSFRNRKLNVGVLDRALDLLEGLDGGGLTWMFPADPLDPVVIRTACGRAEVWAMPLR